MTYVYGVKCCELDVTNMLAADWLCDACRAKAVPPGMLNRRERKQMDAPGNWPGLSTDELRGKA